MSQWINCSERMPPDGSADYLIVTYSGHVCISDYAYDDEIGWCFWYDPDATHWMPLPDAPE